MSGKVIWLTGLSGAGKTTLAKQLVVDLNALKCASIFLDGDILRNIFLESGNGSNYFTAQNRLALAMKYSKLCKLISEQGFVVVIATISMFDEIYAWNRKNLPNYFEVYLKVPLEELRRRDCKGIYSAFDRGTLKNVAGLDLAVSEPTEADLVLDLGNQRTVEHGSQEILKLCMQGHK